MICDSALHEHAVTEDSLACNIHAEFEAINRQFLNHKSPKMHTHCLKKICKVVHV